MGGLKIDKSQIVFDREPFYVTDGIPVFIKREDVESYDEYAIGNPYSSGSANSPWDEFRLSTTTAALSGSYVLDAGCGDGSLTSRLVSSHQVEAFDISISAVRVAQTKVPQSRFAVADATDPPYAPGLFDSIVAANLFEHVDVPCRMLCRMNPLLRKGGKLVISTPSRYRTVNFRRVIRGRSIRFNHSSHVTEYTCGQVEEILRWAGFELIDVHTNLKCRTLIGSVAARIMQAGASAIGSHTKFGDPTIYVARRQ